MFGVGEYFFAYKLCLKHNNQKGSETVKLPRTIYLLRHNPTGRIYIGSSASPERRYKRHIEDLRKGNHPVEDMQSDFYEYGEDYSFELLDVINDSHESKKEYDLQLRFHSHIRGIGYNYKDWENRKRVRPTKSSKGELLRRIKNLTDEEAEKFVAFLEALDRKDNT